jgi:hypothetical protein
MKLPYTSIRKQLRLFIEELEGGSDATPNDISYVYSVYAPFSVRLVQCVAQMNGVLASFSGDGKNKGKGRDRDGTIEGDVPKMNAHPILGWKGFEDVIATIPGPTVDIIQKGDGTTAKPLSRMLRLDQKLSEPESFYSVPQRAIYDNSGFLFRRLYLCRDFCHKVDGKKDSW